MWKNLTAIGFAGAFLAMAVTPSAAIDEQFALTGVISLPDAQTLSSFDISFVDPQAHALGIAASRVVGSGGPFGTVIIVNPNENVVTAELHASPPFVGNCTFGKPAPQPSINGPNGVIIIAEKGGNAQVWAADGPVFSTPCMATTPLATPSTVKVLDLNSGATIAVIPTGTGAGTKTPGIRRADELCYNPRSHVVLVANNDPLDSFITFIDAETFGVIQRTRFDGTDPNGLNILANGIEQCVFNPRDGDFYLAIPATGTAAASKPGVIVRFSAKAPFTAKVIADFSKAPLNTTGCTGSAGMAAGPAGQLGLSCGLIINDNGGIVANFPSEGNSDEMWYNSGNNHYFLAVSTCKQTVTTTGCLGVIDAGPPPSADTVAGTAPGSHSVAADLRTNQVFVPIRGNAEVAPPGPFGSLCSKGKDVFGLAGSDALGCIAIYGAPSDEDDQAVRTHHWGRRDNQ